MSNLHAYFTLQNLQGFSKALDGSRSQTNTQSVPALSSSGGKSWTRNAFSSLAPHIDVNAKDWLGRSILHIACAAPETSSLAYIRLLLAHSNINVNLPDTESRWTALHRSLYAGNIAASQLLMQRSDIDLEQRDSEGLTAFDLYNSTVDGTGLTVPTTPSSRRSLKDGGAADLFTWGRNRNAALGHGDGDDRTYPDQVVILNTIVPESMSDKLAPVQVRAVSMAKLHTTVITTENQGNLRVCGFGSGGRLGLGQHTQYSLLPVPQFTHHVVAIALGQDHTLVLTSDGEVLSWGLNRFSQLGYVVDPPTSSVTLNTRAREEPIQAVARKVAGPLKKEVVIGVAACKTASACWTESDVYTWGTNHGQLGYDKAAQPVQVLPRKVTGVQAILDLAMTDSAMACLLKTEDVICFRDDSHFRVKFPTPEFSDFSPYVHPFIIKPPIAKITSCDDTFAALSSRGDVFLFSAPSASSDGATGRVERPAVKPQKVWSLRKSPNPARDIALGSDGELILCTESGHVFVGSRSTKSNTSAKALKFSRVPFIHRVVKVCANSTGAFGALRSNYDAKPLSVTGPSLIDDLKGVRPWTTTNDTSPSAPSPVYDDLEDEEGLEMDVADIMRLCALLLAEKATQKSGGQGLFRGQRRFAHGADVIVQSGMELPVHRVILAARSPVLRDLMGGSNTIIKDGALTVRYLGRGTRLPRLLLTGCHPMAILLLLEYLYSDDIPAFWDRRAGVRCDALFKTLKLDPVHVKTELEVMASMLQLPALSAALSASVKRVPSPTLHKDMRQLFHGSPATQLSAVKADVYLELADKVVACHSVILRARCPFFRNFFDEEEWTINRWRSDGTLSVNMKHLEWRAVSFVMTWMYDGNAMDLFNDLDSAESISDFLDVVFAVMRVANELLLDQLMLICSVVVLRHVHLGNVIAILANATYYNALPLVESLHDFVACNLEALMESHFLDNMDEDLMEGLSVFVRSRQADKSPIMRSNLIAETALRNASTWLELQDLPQPVIRSHPLARNSPKLDPVGYDQSTPRRSSVPTRSPLPSPALRDVTRYSPPRTPADEIFAMEDVHVDSIPTLHIGQPQSPTAYTVPGHAWKSKSRYEPAKVNMKTIMAEAVISRSPGTNSGSTEVPNASNPTPSRSFQKPSQRQRRRMDAHTPNVSSEHTSHVSSPVSPWKTSDRQTSAAANPTSVSASVALPATPMTVLQVSNSPLRSDSAPELVPRRSHTDAPAWTHVSGNDPSTSSQLSSFVAIQQQQREQVHQPKGKQSLREIQQEEQAKQEEEDFLKWWAAEEQRLKSEAKATDPQLSGMNAGSSLGRERRGQPGRRRPGPVRNSRGRGGNY
ncbi:hypothetical protein JB92DRAFT_2862754 [Gautieria morchelliformis]|nr:hypothetical protein JB92DRAFT_2862754 [Gautieria morchelliformis]